MKNSVNHYVCEAKRVLVNKLDAHLKTPLVNIPYAGTRLLAAADGNKKIKELLSCNEPIIISRLGNSEMIPVMNRELKRNNIAHNEICDKRLCTDAGFFPYDVAAIDKYRDLLIKSVSGIDFLGIWMFIDNEEYFAKKYMDNPICARAKCLEPFYFHDPWSEVLRGKKVLIVHPFEETIKAQYEKREKLFENCNILPEFDMRTLKAVQTVSDMVDPRFNTWFDALEWMKNEIAKIDFNIALLGCGAYGIPLQHYIKELGKSSVYIGGGLQLMFGIKGRRWDNHPYISKLYNEQWVRPSDSEKVINMEQVDQFAPYW